MKIAIDCDELVVDLKIAVAEHLTELGFNVTDLEYQKANPDVDYPDIGNNLAEAVRDGKYDRGILICGTGIGMAIVANKVESVYSGVCHDVYSAERLIKSNNGNLLAMGGLIVGKEHAKKIAETFANAHFESGRSDKKVKRLRDLEHMHFNAK